MKFIVIGDMHIGKTYFPFLNFVENPYFHFNGLSNFSNLWSSSVVDYIKSCIDDVFQKYPSDIIEIVFLGDVMDNPRIDEQILDDIFKNQLLDYILDMNSNSAVSVVVGNHDKIVKGQQIASSKLNNLQDYRGRVSIYETTILKKLDQQYIYFPYIRKQEFVSNLKKLSPELSNDSTFIFTHNNIYMNNYFRSTPTFLKEDIEDGVYLAENHIPRMLFSYNNVVLTELFKRIEIDDSIQKKKKKKSMKDLDT